MRQHALELLVVTSILLSITGCASHGAGKSAGTTAAVSSAASAENISGLQRKISMLTAELRERDRRLASLLGELGAAKSISTVESSSAQDVRLIQENAQEISILRRQLNTANSQFDALTRDATAAIDSVKDEFAAAKDSLAVAKDDLARAEALNAANEEQLAFSPPPPLDYAFNAPEEMYVGEKIAVFLQITRSTTDTNVAVNVTTRHESAPGKSSTYSGVLDSSTGYVEAQVYGPNFQIKLENPGKWANNATDTQLIPETGYAEWTWTVTAPQDPGDHDLHVTVRAVKEKNGEFQRAEYLDLKDQADHTIAVKVVPLRKKLAGFVGDTANWKWIATALIIPFGTWLFGRVQGKKSKPG